jgi:hypothetical protein
MYSNTAGNADTFNVSNKSSISFDIVSWINSKTSEFVFIITSYPLNAWVINSRLGPDYKISKVSF